MKFSSVMCIACESTLELNGASAMDVKTQHDQPAVIQQLEWLRHPCGQQSGISAMTPAPRRHT